MLVIVTTPTNSTYPAHPFVVTLDTRTVFLLSRARSRALRDGESKVHWARRVTPQAPATPVCNASVIGYAPWTGKVTDITCSKCKAKWWENERILGSGGAQWIQNLGP